MILAAITSANAERLSPSILLSARKTRTAGFNESVEENSAMPACVTISLASLADLSLSTAFSDNSCWMVVWNLSPSLNVEAPARLAVN